MTFRSKTKTTTRTTSQKIDSPEDSLGSLSNHDGDGNKNAEKSNGLLSQTTTLHVRHCTTTMWKCLISRFMEDVNKRRRIFLSWLESGPQQINSREKAAGYIWHPNSNLISILSPLPFLIIPYQSRRPPHRLSPSVLFIFIMKSVLWYDVYILGNC